MAISIEKLLRGTEFTETDKKLILKGIMQVAKADGVLDPREQAYIKKFVTEFFPEADLEDDSLSETITSEELSMLSSDDAKRCFVAFLTITAYADEDFSKEEREFLKTLFKDLLNEEEIANIQHSVRIFLYRRTVFSFALKNLYLHPEFAQKMAERFDISTDEAIEVNQGVFNALMVLKPIEQNDKQAES